MLSRIISFVVPARGVVLAIVVVTLSASNAFAVTASEKKSKDTNDHAWKPTVKSVAVFKNGLGFFTREGETRLHDGWCLSSQIPPAAFGTLAIYSLDENELVDIVGSGKGKVIEFDDVDQPDTDASRREQLGSLVRLKIQVTSRHDSQDRTAAGKLLSIGPEFIILDSGSNCFAVPLKEIRKIEVLELPLRVHVSKNEKMEGDSASEVPAKDVDGNRAARLGMAYLRKGVTWIPEYSLRVISEDEAELTLRGTLVNEAEDLIHTDVHFVVGVPHFVHTDYMAPIAVGQMIRTIGTAVAPQMIQSQIMNRAAMVSNSHRAPAMTNPVVSQAVQHANTLSSAIGNLPKFDGGAASDYTVYTKKNLTVRRGEKAIVTLFKKRIKFSHIYDWSTSGQIRHSLSLHNATDSAWTTGPCLAVKEMRPLSEDLLKYTPKGSRGELPVTAAINIAAGKQENETDRKLKAYHVHTTYFDLVTLEGTLNLHNYEKRPVTIRIAAPITGKPLTASDSGRIGINSSQLKLTERAGSVSWTVTLEPGERKTLTYSYERYVRSY